MTENIFKSKYLKRSVNLSDIYGPKDEESESSSESESDSDSDMKTNNFIIDSKADSNIKVVKKMRKQFKEPKIDSHLKVKPYLSQSIPTEQKIKLLDDMSVKTMNEELSKKLVIKPGFEQNFCIKPFTQSKRLKKLIRRKENQKTLGKKWFGMTAEEMTEEKKNDLLALNMRKSWDPKRFYKKNDRKDLPNFFQIGTIIESKADYYHSRVPKKDRKRTLVEELLADADFKRYSKKRYSEALAKNPYYLKMKRRKERQKNKSKGIDFKQRRKEKKNKQKTETNV